jgi:hypothetical protein
MATIHVIHVVVESDERTTAELAEDIRFLVEQTSKGYIGNPDEHELYGAHLITVA